MLESRVVLEPPNGGYGWIVVFAAMIINIFNKAFFSVFGLLYGPLFTSINVQQSDISLVLNLASFFSSFSAIFTGALFKFLSYRQVSVLACFLTSIGIALSSFAASVYQVVFTFSMLTGTGLGLLANSTLIAVTSYFTSKKRKAVSFSLAGTGIGQIVLPQVVKGLNTIFTVRESILLMGALVSHGLVGAVLFQSVKKYLVPKVCDETQSLKFQQVNQEPAQQSKSFWQWVSDTMDLSLLKDVHFLILNFVLACGYAVFIDFTLVLPFFLENTKVLDRAQTAFCLSILATSDLISRLTFHFITDRFDMSSKQTFVIGVFLLGIIKTSMTFLTSYHNILFACLIYGYVRATLCVNQILVLSEHCTKFYPERFPGALGLSMLFNGVSVMTFGQLFGLFRNSYSDFSYSFYLEDVFLIFVLSAWLIEYFCYR